MRIPACQDTCTFRKDRAIGGSQFGAQLRRQLDVGQPCDFCALEQRLAPFFAPHEVLRDDRSLLDDLFRPYLDAFLDVCFPADRALLTDDRPFLDDRILTNADAVHNDSARDSGVFPDVSVVPDYRPAEPDAFLDDAVCADDAVLKHCMAVNPCVVADYHRALECRPWADGDILANSNIAPDKVEFLAGDIHLNFALEYVIVRFPVRIRIANVAPVSFHYVTEQRAAF